MFWVALILLATAGVPDLTRVLAYKCDGDGLEQWDIRGTYHVDAGGGVMRSGGTSFGFSVGPMTAPLVPTKRPPGFRWFRVEKRAGAVLAYGFNVREKQMQATIFGAPFGTPFNIVGAPEQEKTFVTVVRVLSRADCEVKATSRR